MDNVQPSVRQQRSRYVLMYPSYGMQSKIKNIRVVAQVAPAVRIAVGDHFQIPKGENSFAKLVEALRIMGFDQIYDTNFAADLTVMEESAELRQD